MNKKYVFVVFLCSLILVPESYAEIVAKYCINNIRDFFRISREIKDEEEARSPVVIWDIDDTLIYHRNNQDIPRDNEETIQVIKDFADNGFKELVVTARLRGNSATIGIYAKAFKFTINTLDNILLMNLSTYGAIPDNMNINFWIGSYVVIVHGSVIFAGSREYSEKGKRAAVVIDYVPALLSEKPTHLFPIDDSQAQLDNYEEIFRSRKEKVYLFHYPKPEHEYDEKDKDLVEKCHSSYKIIDLASTNI